MLKDKNKIAKISLALALGLSVSQVHAEIYTTVIDEATYGKYGTITLDDWGFVGPNGRTALDFEPVNGFNFDAIGQRQHVVTRTGDLLTPDAPADTKLDLYGGEWFGGGIMDATVSFYKWAYTTKAGSTFSNMLIDTDGDYFIAQKDMDFVLYDVYTHTGTLPVDDNKYHPDGTFYTNIAFKPYVLSNAKGWCGSVLASNPGALEAMAGQVMFDFAFDVYLQTSPGVFTYSSTEIVKDFEMRSYGTITINVAEPGTSLTGRNAQTMTASAVVNNTNPGIGNLQVVGAPADPDYYNLVSFHGGGVLEKNVGRCGILNPDWVGGTGLSLDQVNTFKYTGLINNVADAAACEAAGGTWQEHAYGGYAYILRADGIRVIEAMDYSVYPDLTNVPNVIDGVAYNNDENGISQPIADLSDTDGDGVANADDNCPATANADQSDRGGVGSIIPDGIGDACQCGDVNNDGKVTNTDSTLIKLFMFGLTMPSMNTDFCDVNGDSSCTNTDSVLIQRTLLDLPPGLKQTCKAAGNN